jgi:hypothetical protein
VGTLDCACHVAVTWLRQGETWLSGTIELTLQQYTAHGELKQKPDPNSKAAQGRRQVPLGLVSRGGKALRCCACDA